VPRNVLISLSIVFIRNAKKANEINGRWVKSDRLLADNEDVGDNATNKTGLVKVGNVAVN
jgi:hypothetical protein